MMRCASENPSNRPMAVVVIAVLLWGERDLGPRAAHCPPGPRIFRHERGGLNLRPPETNLPDMRLLPHECVPAGRVGLKTQGPATWVRAISRCHHIMPCSQSKPRAIDTGAG